jgi:hypothetical protein
MTGKTMQWHKASKLDRMHDHELRGQHQIIPVKTDDAFWQCWRDDPRGYHVRKVNGQWQAWIER